jgi:Leucine-rich repeat (LRR) protein
MTPQALKDYQKVVESIHIQEQKTSTNRLEFTIKNCFYLETIPSEITLLHDLKILRITNCTRLKFIPDELEYLEHLEEVIFEGSKTLPSGFEYFIAIKQLTFRNCPFLKQTNWNKLPTLPSLQSLVLHNCLSSFSTIPASVFQPNLTRLVLTKNQITLIPLQIAFIQGLQELLLDDNPIKDFPMVLLDLPHLVHLAIPASALALLPPETLALAHIPTLKITTIREKDKLKITLFQSLLTFIQKEAPPITTQTLLLKSITNHNQLSTYSQEQLFTILDTPIPTLPTLALEVLNRRFQSLDKLPNGSKIVLKGTLKGKLTVLKQRLHSQNFMLGNKVTAQTNYIIIGLGAKVHQWLDIAPNATLITEKILLQYLDKVAPTYLSNLAQEDETVIHIRTLLLSNNPPTILLGLELVQAGGLPTVLKEVIFWVYKTQSNLTIKRLIRHLFGVHFSAQTNAALRSKKQLKPTLSEKTLTKNIAYFVREANLDALRLISLIHTHWQKGLDFVENHLELEKQKKFYQSQENKTVKD